jgi:predicted small lipoprotein YifL
MRIALAILAAVSSLSACGLRGSLERPLPLWGNPPNEGPLDPRTIKAAEEKAKAEKEREAAEKAARDAAQPQTTVPMPGAPQ